MSHEVFTDFTVEQLVDQGWDPTWVPVVPGRNSRRLTLTLRDAAGNVVHAVAGMGRTHGEAMDRAADQAKDWLQRRGREIP
jgi:hypothetical protein